MTAQCNDEVFYRSRWFELTGIEGSKLFEPKDHCLEPMVSRSDCIRGYICRYSVSCNRLYLTVLFINDSPLSLFGVNAEKPDREHGFDRVFVFPNLEQTFTGKLLLSDGFMGEYYVHSGFHPAWKYRETHELIFQDGSLIGARECSSEMNERRKTLWHSCSTAAGQNLTFEEYQKYYLSRSFDWWRT
jgi:hypothetical protein